VFEGAGALLGREGSDEFAEEVTEFLDCPGCITKEQAFERFENRSSIGLRSGL